MTYPYVRFGELVTEKRVIKFPYLKLKKKEKTYNFHMNKIESFKTTLNPVAKKHIFIYVM